MKLNIITYMEVQIQVFIEQNRKVISIFQIYSLELQAFVTQS